MIKVTGCFCDYAYSPEKRENSVEALRNGAMQSNTIAGQHEMRLK
jgi:hypothetical protein